VSVIRVAGPAPYDVHVGHGALSALPSLIPAGVTRVAVVHAPGLYVGLPSSYEVLDLEVPDGEAAKSASVLASCWEALGAAGFTRSDCVVTVGGGATTDLGGFVAATWLRGVPVVHVPTSLLAMVDAAVGGKTGIDTEAGKNLVGAFHEPAGVVCDLSFLATLPPAELVSGLGEVIKCGFIADPSILSVVEASPAAVLDPASPELASLVEKAVAVKAAVVAGDLRETGASGGVGRELLNYGHTLAHAIEKVSGYSVRHGEAVALGMVYVAELARLSGLMPPALAARHAAVLASVGLPVRWSGAPFADLLEVMRVDKKTRGSLLRFVVLSDLATPSILAGPAHEHLVAAYEALA
jgi:3-dehydroquinate synthase